MSNDSRIPVIVGVGEITDKPANPAEGLEPLALMAEALKRAEQDAGAKLVAEIDSIDLVNLVSWRYEDPARQLCERLGIAPKRAVYGPVGGEGPIRFLHEAALRIQRGESVVGAVCGAEAQSTVNKAEKAGVKLPWTPFAEHGVQSVRSASWQHPLAIALGVFQPITVYPFYDAATAAHWGQTPREALRESGELWSTFSGVAAKNPHSWLKRAFEPEAIMTPTADNRLIAWPYNKLMVANPMVNQGAALIVTSLAKARAAGVREDRMVYFVGGASAEEPRDYLLRDQYVESYAQNAVLNTVIDLAGGDGTNFDAIELYSCFPCVPKMARRTLGFGADVQPTVTGGLTFFGAPLNSYMTHAACAMVHARARRRKVRPAVWPGRLRHKTPRAGAGAEGTGRAAVGQRQRAGDRRQAARRSAEVQSRGQRQGEGRELHGDLRPRRRGEARRRHPAQRRERTHACARSGRRQGDARAPARSRSLADRLGRRHHQGRRRHAGMEGGVTFCHSGTRRKPADPGIQRSGEFSGLARRDLRVRRFATPRK